MACRPAQPSDHAAIITLLHASDLPTADLPASQVRFIVATRESRVTGVVGIEPFGDTGLLRSLAVHSEHRRSGTGMQLLDAAEAAAYASGMRQLVLLTQTAAPFFARRGYHTTDRRVIPAAVAASAQFRALCPASATCMSKALGESVV